MTLRRWFTAYVCVAFVFLAMDAAWLSFMQSRAYQPALGHLLAPSVELLAAGLFYPLYFLGVVVFGVRPEVSDEALRSALLRGALLGLVCYGTYDLTNQATLRDWPWHITALDLAWGATVTGIASLVARRFAFPAIRSEQSDARRTD